MLCSGIYQELTEKMLTGMLRMRSLLSCYPESFSTSILVPGDISMSPAKHDRHIGIMSPYLSTVSHFWVSINNF